MRFSLFTWQNFISANYFIEVEEPYKFVQNITKTYADILKVENTEINTALKYKITGKLQLTWAFNSTDVSEFTTLQDEMFIFKRCCSQWLIIHR